MRFLNKLNLHLSLQEISVEVLSVIEVLQNRLVKLEKEHNEEIKSLKMQLKNQQTKMTKLENDLQLRTGNNYTSVGLFPVTFFLNFDDTWLWLTF